ncbi:MAG: hypothetical protein WAR37_02685 [Candidatus Microsaccharimonas sp.]
MDEIKAKQQIVEKIKESDKILVTVSDGPSVDALSAALGLTMLFEKQEKYATAIFSGEIPKAISFLEPEKTFDETTDSLRDFIIALDKEKADHLRMPKPEAGDDKVRIYVTPYKSTITQDDLEFSQGDYNVELVIALGVDNQDHLDKALESHGQILHDAAIITLTAGDQSSALGGIDWHDANASSLSEMVAGLAEALKEDKKKSLLDTPIATALLTGIVAETDRFSNEHTTSRSLTVAANLMTAGADQQLIATELQLADSKPEIEAPVIEPEITEDSPEEPEQVPEVEEDQPEPKKDSTTLSIEHEEARKETLAELDRRVMGEEKAREKIEDEVEAVQEVEAEPDTNPNVQTETITVASTELEGEPLLGGTLNATTEQAAEEARREEESDHNKTILEHAIPGNEPPVEQAAPVDVHSSYALDSQENQTTTSTESSIATGISGERILQPIEQQPTPDLGALPPVQQPAPTPTPVDLGLPLPPPIPDFSQQNGLPQTSPLSQTEQPAILGDILAPEPDNYNTTNAVPAPNTAYAIDSAPSLPPLDVPNEPDQPDANKKSDPSQFQIPPQQ